MCYFSFFPYEVQGVFYPYSTFFPSPWLYRSVFAYLSCFSYFLLWVLDIWVSLHINWSAHFHRSVIPRSKSRTFLESFRLHVHCKLVSRELFSVYPPISYECLPSKNKTSLTCIVANRCETLPCVLHAQSLRRVRLCETRWTAVLQAPRSMGFSRQGFRVACWALPQGVFLTQGSSLHPLGLLRWQVGSLPSAPPGKP